MHGIAVLWGLRKECLEYRLIWVLENVSAVGPLGVVAHFGFRDYQCNLILEESHTVGP